MTSGLSVRRIVKLVGVFAVLSVLFGCASGQAGAAQSAPCFPATQNFEEGPLLMGGEALGNSADTFSWAVDLGTHSGSEILQSVSDCAEVEIEDETGNSYDFQFPDNGTSTAHRVQFSAPSECKIAKVQKQVVFGKAARNADCVGALLIVHLSSVYAFAQRQVPTGPCTKEEAYADHCSMFATVVKKQSPFGRASREAFSVSISAATKPSSSEIIPSGQGQMTFRFARTKGTPEHACPPGQKPGCSI
jgi:hypothetical protein